MLSHYLAVACRIRGYFSGFYCCLKIVFLFHFQLAWNETNNLTEFYHPPEMLSTVSHGHSEGWRASPCWTVTLLKRGPEIDSLFFFLNSNFPGIIPAALWGDPGYRAGGGWGEAKWSANPGELCVHRHFGIMQLDPHLKPLSAHREKCEIQATITSSTSNLRILGGKQRACVTFWHV